MARVKSTNGNGSHNGNGHTALAEDRGVIDAAKALDVLATKATPKHLEASGGTILVRELSITTIPVPIKGISPYVQHAFGAKARAMMKAKQMEGSAGKSKKVREPKDFEAQMREGLHTGRMLVNGKMVSVYGIPANGLRAAMVAACRVSDVKMTLAKLAVFIEPDCFDDLDGTPLVVIHGVEDSEREQPHYHECAVRLETGVADIRARPMWDAGWTATVRLSIDQTTISRESAVNLLHRAGRQVGIGEGRPGSPKSCGMGWGVFDIVLDK